VPKYKLLIHRRVHKFLIESKNEKIKSQIKDAITKLEDYPLSLRELDVEKVKGLKNTFRIRVSIYRIVFYIDKTERTVYLTHTEIRKSVYKGLH